MNPPLRLEVSLAERSYPILIGRGLLGSSLGQLPELAGRRCIVVTNPTVAHHHLAVVRRALGDRADAVIEIPDGEAHKNWETLDLIITRLLEHRAERRTVLVALGGGVVGDVAGFAAAIYQRGMPIVQIPTTLLAMVDSSVGGKTAINHPLGKNMVGAFYQPMAVVIDTDTLSTLPPREFSAGLAEVLKYGFIRDHAFLRWLEANLEALLARDPSALAEAIATSCRIKAQIVGRDERESGERELLNYGHTFGHAIEAALGYGQWLHGEAVAAGMVLAARLSRELGHLGDAEVERVRSVLARARLPVSPPSIASDQFLELMARDKKVADGRIRYVVLRSIGDAYVRSVEAAGVRAILG